MTPQGDVQSDLPLAMKAQPRSAEPSADATCASLDPTRVSLDIERASPDSLRGSLEQQWLELTARTLPLLSTTRGWPIREGHCFQRVLLDAVCGGVWTQAIVGRPAYRHLDGARLAEAVALAEAAAAGTLDLGPLNAGSLAARRALRSAQAAQASARPIRMRCTSDVPS